MNIAYRVWDGRQMHYWNDEGLSLTITDGEWKLWRIIPGQLSPVLIAESRNCKQVLMWGSGEKDKNSKRIYEDDIADGERYHYRRFNVLIKFGMYEQDASGGEYSGAECIGFYAEAINPKEIDDIGCHIVSDYERQASLLEFTEVEVIGNAYQNPEMLSGAAK